MSVTTGSHHKSIEHIAYKYRVSRTWLKVAWDKVKNVRTDVVLEIPTIPTTIGEEQQDYSIAYKNLLWDPALKVLRGPTSSEYIFSPDLNVSECRTCGNEPDEDCSCGFYVYWDPVNAFHYDARIQCIVAQVRIGGIVVAHEYGARAQYLRIEGLCLMTQHKRFDWYTEVCDTYGINMLDKAAEREEYRKQERERRELLEQLTYEANAKYIDNIKEYVYERLV
jgi:hypothetical protein